MTRQNIPLDGFPNVNKYYSPTTHNLNIEIWIQPYKGNPTIKAVPKCV